MQQETPQVGSGPTPSSPTPQGDQEHNFYSAAPPSTYAPSMPTRAAPAPATAGLSVSWDASEYVHNDKGAGWMVGFVIVVVVLTALAFWIGSWTFAILIIVMATAMGIFAYRPPHVLHYMLDDEGIEIAGTLHRFENFRAYGILAEGAFYTISLIPVKRFGPALNVYFAEQDGEKIVDIMNEHLPMEKIEPDFIDNLMRRLRF